MISISKRFTLLTVFFTVVLSFSCKDDTITNIYLDITKQNRIDETINSNHENKLLNVTVYDLKSNEAANDVIVTLKFSEGILITKITNSSGNVKFVFDKSITGICEIYAESNNNVCKGKTYLEVF
ncbi:MAG: hypothetical protein M3R36_12260 [Bacteroidota bacterium]|nr:hypothetical protein [Bacteroidota bacterium]